MRRAWPLLVLGLVAVIAAGLVWSSRKWQLELDERSEYSHIRVRRRGDLRTLLFVRDSGREVTESRIDLSAPHRLQLPYSRVMFASYLLVPDPERVLIVGLGGGGMVHFLRHHEPDVHIDVVEIDPVVVRIADELFDVRSTDDVHILTEDAFDYLERCTVRYDVIYMDAFLKPSAGTDAAGVPLRMRTLEFYEQVRSRLAPGGAVAFNLTPHEGAEEDIRTVEQAFPGTLVLRCPPARNLVLIAPGGGGPIAEEILDRRARELDGRFDVDFSFRTMLSSLRSGEPR